ncbi:MAG: response regulator [Actinomycetota bacterium]
MNPAQHVVGAKAANVLTDAKKAQVPVLVVDDSASKRLALRAILAPLGYCIVEADSGIAALRCLMAQDFAVILLDVRMPNMDGFETAAQIRQRRQSEVTPIIFVTAYGSRDIADIDRYYAGGAVDFIFAPVPADELRAKVSVFAKLFIRAEELATTAREVQASADQLRFLTEAAPIGIFQTDAENKYIYTNPRWSEITGVQANEAAGRVWDFIIGPEQQSDLIAALAGGPQDKAEVCQRFLMNSPGSPSKVVLVTSKSIPNRDGEIAGWVGTLADVTAEAGVEVAMSDARDAANEASRLKSEFLANMSHEIRTPMNGVIGMTDLLLETNLDTRQRDYAQTVRNSGEALLSTINGILDFSKIEAGRLEIEDIEFSPATVVGDVVDLLAGSAQAKGLELVAVFEESLPVTVGGDPGRVRQVLTNLIGNAIKFTQAGEIVVRAEARAEGTKSVVRFEVSDTGDGIPPDKLDTVFQPFTQADSSTSRKYGGTGLGLAISAQLIGLMGGSCGASSRLGLGSKFWFTIGVTADAGQAGRSPESPDSGLAGVTALIVDDNATQRGVLAEYLSGWGMTVETAESGQVALAAMRRAAVQGNPFAVVLIDRSMPGMDGLELMDAIRDDPALTSYLVLMTNLGQDRDLGAAAETGVCAIVFKPIHPDRLQAGLRMALGLQGPEVDAHQPTALSSSLPGQAQGGWLLLAEDNLINQKVAVAILSGAGYRVDTALNGLLAVQAAAANDYDAILMDCQMPELNGYEATAAIRAQEGPGRHTSIIALTAGARPEDRDRCLAEGMDSYLAKPVKKDALLALVARSLKPE